MPDVLDASGLQVQTAAEITTALVSGMQSIYGADINTDQNSPDGQMIGLMTQMAVDIRELLVSINNGFDPDQAIGAILDQRVAINNIERNGGTYTIQPIGIITTGTVTLQGLDSNFSNPNGTGYTVQDSSGNQFILVSTATLGAGTNTLSFRAKMIGAVDVLVNTITIPVTIVLGVSSVNNSSSALTIGEIQETDTQLRTRRQQSVALATTGYLNGLLGKIQALDGVTEAVLYENNTGTIDANGIPGHSIWLIVAGGSSADIGNTLYTTIDPGCGMKGAQTFNITTASGALFVAKWDNPTAQNLWIKFSIQTTVTGYSFSTAAIKTYIANNLLYNIGQFAETSAITAAAAAGIAAQGGGGVAVLMTISNDNITYTDYLTTTGLNYQWTLDPSRIAITVIP